jgi:pilus assembly protein Flp/PilA
MTSSLLRLRNRLVSEKGATMVEYGLMVALIAVVVVLAVGPLGKAISTMFDGIATSI